MSENIGTVWILIKQQNAPYISVHFGIIPHHIDFVPQNDRDTSAHQVLGEMAVLELRGV